MSAQKSLNTPAQTYRDLMDLHRRTIVRLQNIQNAHGFGDHEIVDPLPESALLAEIRLTEQPDLVQAVFRVPTHVAMQMFDRFTAYTQQISA